VCEQLLLSHFAEDPLHEAVLNQVMLLSCERSTTFRCMRKQQALTVRFVSASAGAGKPFVQTSYCKIGLGSFLLHAYCATSSKHPIAANVS
jgi:hypothetical protein